MPSKTAISGYDTIEARVPRFCSLANLTRQKWPPVPRWTDVTTQNRVHPRGSNLLIALSSDVNSSTLADGWTGRDDGTRCSDSPSKSHEATRASFWNSRRDESILFTYTPL